MLNNSGVFDYINALGTSLDATAVRNNIINNNIANVNTPNYKQIGRASCRERVCQYV